MIINNIQDIRDIISELDLYNFTIELIGTPVNDRYPEVKLSIDNQIVWTGAIVNSIFLNFDSIVIDNPEVCLEIDYFNKLDNDTIVDENEIIVANQSVKINSLSINGLLISGDHLPFYSSTTYRLTETQTAAYNSNSFPWKDVKTNILWNNGSWKIKLRKPIIASLIKQKGLTRQVFELSHSDILNKLQNYFKE